MRRVSETVASDETGNSKSGSSLEVLKQLVNHEPDRHPLVIALVAPLGTRTDTLLDQLRDTLRSFKYDLNLVTLSELLDEIPCAPWEQLPARDHAGYYESRMGAGDTLRERTGSGATLAGLAIGKIADHRRSDEAQPATAYVLRSLKHPDEAELLKHIYGDAFWLLALVSDADERREDFAEQLSAAGATFDDRRLEADVLIARDENDESAANGQHVGSVFKRADYYLPIRRGFDCRDDVERFLNGVFGKPFMTPFELEEAMRRSSAQGVLFGQTVANVAGISGSDLECLDFLNLEGRVTAGRLAEVTGLTTGAITGVVDRLEKAALVRRERDEADRRKVFIATVPENVGQIARFYVPMQAAMQKLWSTYSDAELQLLLRFASEGYKAVLEATEALKGLIDAPKEKPARKPKQVP